MVKCMKKVFIVAIILLGIIVLIILASIGPYRLQQARKEAERFAEFVEDRNIDFRGQRRRDRRAETNS